MQEIKKQRIVIASVLKPVDDTRMYEKLGLTLATQYQVCILGYPSTQMVHDAADIAFVASSRFARLSLKRWVQKWKWFLQWQRFRPSMIVICTHELLIPGVLYKVVYNCKLIYDIQENYYQNILYTKAFPLIVRPVLAFIVRLKEKLLCPLVDGFLLAEKVFATELDFLPSKRSFVIENKFRAAEPISPALNRLPGKHLIFTGTIAESTGVFRAIEIARAFHAWDNEISLTIAGYCALEKDRSKLFALAAQYPFIHLLGVDHLVPHARIVELVKAAGSGFITNQISRVNAGRVPTKLFEYLSLHLPMIMVDHPPWRDRTDPYDAAVYISNNTPVKESFYQTWRATRYYSSSPKGTTWDDQALWQALATF